MGMESRRANGIPGPFTAEKSHRRRESSRCLIPVVGGLSICGPISCRLRSVADGERLLERCGFHWSLSGDFLVEMGRGLKSSPEARPTVWDLCGNIWGLDGPGGPSHGAETGYMAEEPVR